MNKQNVIDTNSSIVLTKGKNAEGLLKGKGASDIWWHKILTLVGGHTNAIYDDLL